MRATRPAGWSSAHDAGFALARHASRSTAILRGRVSVGKLPSVLASTGSRPRSASRGFGGFVRRSDEPNRPHRRVASEERQERRYSSFSHQVGSLYPASPKRQRFRARGPLLETLRSGAIPQAQLPPDSTGVERTAGRATSSVPLDESPGIRNRVNSQGPSTASFEQVCVAADLPQAVERRLPPRARSSATPRGGTICTALRPQSDGPRTDSPRIRNSRFPQTITRRPRHADELLRVVSRRSRVRGPRAARPSPD